ncbi:hypothetical protein LCGC14_0405790 [marine sediment metagenome]|uniref:Uncharacterized protein n=1 Tax=marine sediment metagenome TaxID=412755 RepID=A0A0F9SV57_9ZZZZ
MNEAQTISFQQCGCFNVDRLKLVNDKWLCSKCLCECGEELIGIEKSIGICSICNSNDHLADIDWG